MNDIFYKGYWFLPENDEKKIAGTLTFSQENGAELSLDGAFEDQIFFEFSRPDFILGDTIDNKHITLYQCNQFQRGGGKGSKYSAIFVLKGGHFVSEDELLFHQSVSSFYNLNRWLSSRGFSRDTSSPEAQWNIIYNKPDCIPFELQEVIGRLDVDISQSFPTDATYDTAFVRQQTMLCLDYNQSFHLDRLLKDIHHFQNFLTLGTYAPTFPNHIRVYTDQQKIVLGGKEYPLRIDIYYTSPYFRPVKTEHFFLFSYKDIQDNFSEIIRNWYSIDEKIEDPLYLLFGSFYNVPNALESQFLDLARALETFHRRLRNTEMTEAHKEKLKNIIDKVDENDKKWLKEKLAFSHEPTLHERIAEILEEVKNPFLEKAISNYDKFVKDVKNTRNYHTHFNQRLETKAKKEEDLFPLTIRLRLVLICAILKELGFKNEKISELLNRNEPRLFYYLISKEEEKQPPYNEGKLDQK